MDPETRAIIEALIGAPQNVARKGNGNYATPSWLPHQLSEYARAVGVGTDGDVLEALYAAGHDMGDVGEFYGYPNVKNAGPAINLASLIRELPRAELIPWTPKRPEETEMDPQTQAIVKALLMQGEMTPMQQYQNAINNDIESKLLPTDGRVHPARVRYMAGHPVASEPFNPLDELSAPAPETSPRPGPAPGPDWASVLGDLSAQEQQAILGLMQQGAPVDQAFEAILGGGLPAAAQGR